jgi:hypothetical protein
MLFLMVVVMMTPEFGLEYWVVLCTPFGWRPAEWGWQGVVMLVMWRLRKLRFGNVICYVDNFYFFLPKGSRVCAFVGRLVVAFGEMNMPLHEWQVGRRIKAVGWEWWSDEMVMVCPVEKHEKFSGQLVEWAERKGTKQRKRQQGGLRLGRGETGKGVLKKVGEEEREVVEFTLEEVRRIVGKLLWMSAAFPQGKAGVAHWVHMRTAGERVLKAMGGRGRPRDVRCGATEGALVWVRMWAEVFPRWDRRRSIFMGFGPMADEEVLGRVDAATREGDGCGGVYFSVKDRVLLGFTHVWTGEERDRAFILSRESTGVLESFGMRMWFEKFGELVRGKRVLLESDSECLVKAVDRGYSKSVEMMGCVESVLKLSVELRVILRVRWVAGVLNAVADRLSHGEIEEARCLALDQFGVPLLLV